MHLSELKALHVSELIKMGEALEIENVARMRKQELMFAIMKKRAKGGEQVRNTTVYAEVNVTLQAQESSSSLGPI